ncbi:hypothetical protein M407DRAFT_228667 [Tulasnella calospora MUT 4182]|uniref:Protein kinase domain-containing protein n=1 Tax=Tulasnella calospora MUT 4182 TaxID=1051891 RepID=A0A0C3QDG9_9AGAM|nr:hypothetical protein M407DRAFT_228667 [Tulasnella calospora MUT 4182]
MLRLEGLAGLGQRFERQINLWRTLNHPNILALYGWCYIDPDICLVTPWLENQDARNYLARGNVSDEHKLQITIEIAQGLKYLHGRRLLHADVQPSNILIDKDGHAKLGDFALAKALDSNERTSPTSQSSCDLASLRYQPPEVMQEEDVTPAADIYSWAMTFLEIASGAQPFPTHTNVPRLLNLIRKALVPILEDYPSTLFATYPQLWTLLSSCWNQEPTARLSAADLLQSLNQLKSQENQSDNV